MEGLSLLGLISKATSYNVKNLVKKNDLNFFLVSELIKGLNHPQKYFTNAPTRKKMLQLVIKHKQTFFKQLNHQKTIKKFTSIN